MVWENGESCPALSAEQRVSGQQRSALARGALVAVPVAVVGGVAVAVVQVVSVIVVREGNVAAALAVGVRVLVVDGVGHDSSLKDRGFPLHFQ